MNKKMVYFVACIIILTGVNFILNKKCNQSRYTIHCSPNDTVERNTSTKEGSTRSSISSSASLPMIYVITPTHPRPTQLPDMTRFANTLKHVKNLFWIIREDSQKLNPGIIDMLEYSGLNYSYQIAPRPSHISPQQGRGVPGRMSGIRWVQENAKEGVVYLADDDNSYDIRLFDEMRYTKKVSMWPVGSLSYFGISTPIVKNGKVIGFYDQHGGRKFSVDMAGFAVGVPFLLQAKNIDLPYVEGQIETKFLESLGTEIEDIEVKAENCTKVYVWHTQTIKISPLKGINLDNWKGRGTNLEDITKLLAW